ncbi:hypothetical protein U1Q18_014119 [Sarracenia purpurea var. burkii]
MASALAGDDLARSTSSRGSFASGSRRSWASGSFREVWQAPPDVFTRSDRQNDEDELRWAALERLPTYERMRKGMLSKVLEDGKVVRDEIDVTKLGMQDKKQLMERILKVVEDDNDKFLQKLRDRTDRVGIEIPKIEVRYEHLSIEGDLYVGNRALPTLLNSTLNAIEDVLGLIRLAPSKKRKIQILKDVSGIVKPSRFFRQFLAFFGIHQMALSLFRFIAALGRTQPNPDPRINEPTVGKVLLKSRGFFTDDYMFWVCVGALLGFSLLFNILFIAALTFLNPLGDSKAVVLEEDDENKNKKSSGQMASEGIDMAVRNASQGTDSTAGVTDHAPRRGMVLPFQPLSLAFNHVNYYVDMPVLLLMKRGGQVIYAGPLGRQSHKLIEYFEAVPGVPKIRDGSNPATWMLEISASSVEANLDVDFAEVYANSSLYQ